MREPNAVIRLDGSYGEGGGALLRTALAMSALTQQGLKIDNIRANGRFTGLDPEDLTILKALAKISAADVVGGELGAQSLTFLPSARARNMNAQLEVFRTDSGRGPNALISLHAILPILAKTQAYSTVSCRGETYGFNALSYDYFANVTVSALRRMGLFVQPDLVHPGFGRESEGEVLLDIEPSQVNGLEWTERGSLHSVKAIVTTSGMANAMADRALSHLKNMASHANLPMEASHQIVSGKQPGAFVTVWAEYERGIGGGTAMGSRGLKAETLAHSAFDQMTRWMSTSGTVDEYLADQLLLPLVVADSNATISLPRLTDRLMTAIWVVKQFVPIRLTVKGQEGGPATITINR